MSQVPFFVICHLYLVANNNAADFEFISALVSKLSPIFLKVTSIKCIGTEVTKLIPSFSDSSFFLGIYFSPTVPTMSTSALKTHGIAHDPGPDVLTRIINGVTN